MKMIEAEMIRQTVRAAFQAANRLEGRDEPSILTKIRPGFEGEIKFGVRGHAAGRHRDKVFVFKTGDTRGLILAVVLPWARLAAHEMKTTP